MNKVIFITGATSGLGRHGALWLARRGHHVIASGRRENALDTLAQEAHAEGLRLDTLRLDVTDTASISNAVRAVEGLTSGYGVDVLINNAGFGQMGAVLDLDDATVRRQYDTNVFGLLAVTRAFTPQMIARRSGRVINVSSIGGRVSGPMMGVYTSTKFAVEGLSDALRPELAPFGVRVSLVEPGAINTGFSATAQQSVAATGQSGPWASVYTSAMSLFDQAESAATGPAPVSRAFTHAVEARWPRARYVAPRRYLLAIWSSKLLPTWVVDGVVSRVMGLSGIGRQALPDHHAAAAGGAA